MSDRQLFLDNGIGEARGVVTLDGAPERLLIRRDGDDPKLLLGARMVARVASVEPALASAFLDLGGGAQALLSFKQDSRPVRGQSLEIEIRAEPRRGKLAIARSICEASGEPRMLAAAPGLAEELAGYARGASITEGREARDIADQAESEALAVLHPIPGGGTLAIEPTRALTAIDVDLGERKGADAKRVTRNANLIAIGLAARLLRLKGLGGIVVLDLVGRGHDGAALMSAARAAFAPDNPGVAIGPVGRFGTMELSLPRRTRPMVERLCDPDGRASVESLALRLVRRVEGEGVAQSGARLVARAAPEVTIAAQPLMARLAERLGARFSLQADPSFPLERIEVGAA
jgi:Ribonuclease G/E